MTTHNIQIRKGFRWLRALPGVALFALAACTEMTQPAAPTQPAKAYVGLFKDNAVAVVDTGTNRVLRSIPIPAGPHGLVVTPDGRKVYVSSDGASTVSVIDTATDRVVGSIEVGPTPHGLAISPDGSESAGIGLRRQPINYHRHRHGPYCRKCSGGTAS